MVRGSIPGVISDNHRLHEQDHRGLALQRVLGEIGFYLEVGRRTSVIAGEPSKLYRLVKFQLAKM